MRIGLVKETKPAERRVALTESGVATLISDGHEVLAETGAGAGAGIDDAAYERAGAKLVDTTDAWATDLVVKVKEPIAPEYGYLHESTTLFTYLHLAADRALTGALLDAKVTAIAYETVEDKRGGLPLLTPMSEIAGRLAAHAAGQYLMHPHGGPGLLLGGSPGVAPAKVVILGGGVVGTQEHPWQSACAPTSPSSTSPRGGYVSWRTCSGTASGSCSPTRPLCWARSQPPTWSSAPCSSRAQPPPSWSAARTWPS